MRVVKCPVSDVTASIPPSQGQLDEELLASITATSSATCYPDSAFHLQNHWQHRGINSHILSLGFLPLSPFTASHLVLQWVFLSVCLSVLLCLPVGFPFWFSALPLPQTQNTFIFLCPTQAHLNTHINARFPQHWIALMMQAGAYLWAARKHD